MRTTIDIHDALMTELQRRAVEENRSLKEICNEVLAKGLNPQSQPVFPWSCISYAMGSRPVDYTKAWEMEAELEADAVAEKMDLRK